MFVYHLGKFLTGIVLKLGGIRIIGRENIPSEGNYIVIANHTSFGDIPAIARPFAKPLRFLAKEQFGKNPFTRMLFGSGGVTFLDSADSDLSAMRRVISILKAGENVCIFPEGTRRFDQEMVEFKPGAAYIAYRTGVNILPVGLLNTGDFWHIWKRNIIVNIGNPIALDRTAKMNQEYLDRYNDLFFDSVKRLVDENKAIIKNEGKKMRVPSKKYR